MTQPELTLQPVNAKLRDKIRAKLAKISDKHAADLYRENCNGLLDGVAFEGPIVVPPGLDEMQTQNFVNQLRARFQQQETQLVELMQKLWTRLSMLEE